MKGRNYLILLISILVLAAATFYLHIFCDEGGLTWKSTHESFQVSPGQNSVKATFNFKNGSNKSVEIKSVVPDCSCLVTEPSKSTFAPGESGQIEVTFNVGSRYNRVERILKVFTDASDKPALLHLTYDIPELLDVFPRLLFWKTGSENVPKLVTVEMTDHLYAIQKVIAVNRAFQTDVSEITKGKKFEITVRPVDTKIARSTELIIQTDCPYSPWNHIVCELRVQ